MFLGFKQNERAIRPTANSNENQKYNENVNKHDFSLNYCAIKIEATFIPEDYSSTFNYKIELQKALPMNQLEQSNTTLIGHFPVAV